jgi:hypothetical protein
MSIREVEIFNFLLGYLFCFLVFVLDGAVMEKTKQIIIRLATDIKTDFYRLFEAPQPEQQETQDNVDVTIGYLMFHDFDYEMVYNTNSKTLKVFKPETNDFISLAWPLSVGGTLNLNKELPLPILTYNDEDSSLHFKEISIGTCVSLLMEEANFLVTDELFFYEEEILAL